MCNILKKVSLVLLRRFACVTQSPLPSCVASMFHKCSTSIGVRDSELKGDVALHQFGARSLQNTGKHDSGSCSAIVISQPLHYLPNISSCPS